MQTINEKLKRSKISLSRHSIEASGRSSNASVNIALFKNSSSDSNSFDKRLTKKDSIHACNILNDLRCNNELCDGIIKCDDGTEFAVHRAVLSASSKYFYALFTSEMNNFNNSYVHIRDTEAEVMARIIGKSMNYSFI